MSADSGDGASSQSREGPILSLAAVASSCAAALEGLPDDKTINDFWHPQWRQFIRSMKSLIAAGAQAVTEKSLPTLLSTKLAQEERP